MQTANSLSSVRRNRESVGLILILPFIVWLLFSVHSAKSNPDDVNSAQSSFQQIENRLAKTSKQLATGERLPLDQVEDKIGARPLLNLNEVKTPQEIEPFLESIFETNFPDTEKRRLAIEDLQFVARKIHQFIERENHALPNVRALFSIRLDESEQEQIRATIPAQINDDSKLNPLQRAVKRRDDQQAEEKEFRKWLRDREAGTWKGFWRDYVQTPKQSLRQLFSWRQEMRGQQLLTFGQIQQLKPHFIVRRPAEFTWLFKLWCFAAIAAFLILHFAWRWMKFEGDPFILPAIHFLCGLGLVMMVSLPDPLRDELRFVKFTQGILMGATAMFSITFFSMRKLPPFKAQLIEWLRQRSLRTPRTIRGVPIRVSLAAAVALLAALFFLGHSPGESDALVNLWGVQPVEAIRILLVFFLASYFAGNWEYLRQLKNRFGGTQSRLLRAIESLLRRLDIPKLNYAVPVMLAMAMMLLFFFIIGDLGPALVMALTFLSLYAVARKRFGLALIGLGGFAAGAAVSYLLKWPETFYKRLSIVFNIWDNELSGGDQIAHSLWALASGGMLGTMPGRGEPIKIPAAHTDLIISSLGEEMGFMAVLAVMGMYVLLTSRGFNIALRATNNYDCFLGLGLTLATIWQVLLITSGILGIFPLSGVVSPFLSWGNSSMISNFVIFGFLLALSSRQTSTEFTAPFHQPVRKIWHAVSALAVVVIATALYRQVIFAEWHILQGALTRRSDGKFVYQYNPRLIEAPERYAELRLGTIFDRDKAPLAVSDCGKLREFAKQFGYPADKVREICSGRSDRHYPFGDLLSHQLGIRANWSAGNTSYVERDYAPRLRGYDDQACRVARLVAKTPRDLFRDLKNNDNNKAFAISDNEADLTQSLESLADDLLQASSSLEREDGERRWSQICLNDKQTARLENLNDEWNKASAIGENRLVFPVRRQLDELLPLLYHRHDKEHPDVQALFKKDRSLTMSLHIGLQQQISEILSQKAKGKKAAVVVIEPGSGDVLAWVSVPWPKRDIKDCSDDADQTLPRPECVDRAMWGDRPPGSTFKVVTAMAALRMKNGDELRTKTLECESLKDGRAGKKVGGVTVRDHEHVSGGHRKIQMKQALIDSCNAYFAQLGYEEVRADGLKPVTDLLGIQLFREGFDWRKDSSELIRGSFGQGQVLATPFEMARVAATVANDGVLPFGRWVIDGSNQRPNPPVRIMEIEQARYLAEAMRGVVTEGTAKNAMQGFEIPVAGKTGTAENVDCDQLKSSGRLVFRDKSGRIVYREPGDKPATAGLTPVKRCNSHAWFIGFAPYGGARQIAFSVLVENSGGGGGAVAAPIARLIVEAARRQGLIQ